MYKTATYLIRNRKRLQIVIQLKRLTNNHVKNKYSTRR